MKIRFTSILFALCAALTLIGCAQTLAEPSSRQENDGKYYIQAGYIYGPKMAGKFYILNRYIYGPKNSGSYYIQLGYDPKKSGVFYIYGPRKSGQYYVMNNYIYGPAGAPPWLEDDE